MSVGTSTGNGTAVCMFSACVVVAIGVAVSPAQIRRLVHQFLNAQPGTTSLPSTLTRTTHHRRHHGGHTTPSAVVAGLTATPITTTTQALNMQTAVPFPVEVPTLTYDWAAQVQPGYDYYRYRLADPSGRRHWAYRITWEDTKAAPGAWYGIQGTDWTDPPLFANADRIRHGGRTYLEVGNGHHIEDIGWRDGNALYWITNTIFDDLTNDQMVALAESARPVH